MFKHYILTRYNMDLYSLNPYDIEDKDQWMRSRIPLFKRFLMSLMEQENDDFTLVLAVDPETPDHFLSQVETLLNSTAIKWVFQVGGKPKDYVIGMEHETPWIITSRCDSDDLLEPEFVETIQNSFQEKEECLDTRGRQWDGTDYYSYDRKQVGSPFVTLIETTSGEIKTAAYKKHNEMRRFFFNRFVGPKPLFVQWIHGNNVINHIHGQKL